MSNKLSLNTDKMIGLVVDFKKKHRRSYRTLRAEHIFKSQRRFECLHTLAAVTPYSPPQYNSMKIWDPNNKKLTWSVHTKVVNKAQEQLN